MKFGNASAAQIAFFTFALLILIVPLTSFVQTMHPWSDEQSRLIRTALPFVVAACVLFSFPRFRQACRAELSNPVPQRRRTEVILVSLASIAKGFAWAGMWVSYWWLLEGAISVEQRLRMLDAHDIHMARASTVAEWGRSVVLAGLIAPVLEELVFRGFLYRAWERQWGWVTSMFLTSILFGLYHPNFVPAFMASVLYVCMYRRTGTLWAPITAHSLFNIAAFYPFLGQYVFQTASGPSGDLGVWGLQLACMLFVWVGLAIYVWMSRDASIATACSGSKADGTVSTRI